ncbi:MAG: aconitate hydratase [Candidatus Riflebacteria bacterium]|nr:aconitate hydratase [Candidatus Riflebacteria bacterium]
MGLNLTQKIIKSHLLSGEMKTQNQISIRIAQTLTQDATGTMAYLQFEALGVPRVKTELSVSYVDHNTLQEDFKNPDDHEFLRTIAAKHGIVFSRPGNGICHQVHLERFGKPGKTLLGSDSHTPTGGGIGMLAIGAGGLDVAMAMAGSPYTLKMPGVVKVVLTGELPPWVAAKDIILEVLRRDTVKGGVGFVYEYSGPALKNLTVPERATITNMGAELGATSSVFPSDDVTLNFLKAQGREKDWIRLEPDTDAVYERELYIDLSKLEPMAACPHMPDQVKTIRELEGLEVQQVAIGSCTNSSFVDIARVACILDGKQVSPNLSLGISPGSRQVLMNIAEKGYYQKLVKAGARILECTCGPCIGQGFAPPTAGVSVRTFNRNFEKRSGTPDAKLYLVSPEVAAVAAIAGKFTDPRKFGEYPKVQMPEKFSIDDSMIIYPNADGSKVEIKRGPNIAPLPLGTPMPSELKGETLIVTGDNITTDHIMPAGKYLPLRSNVPEYAKHVFEGVDKEFPARAKKVGGGFIIGGENYGQGSSREHAALCPMYLGVKAVIVKSFARIHLANLVNFGILPLTFKNPDDYSKISLGDQLSIDVSNLKGNVTVKNITKNQGYEVSHPLSDRDIEIIKAGGQLSYEKMKSCA